MHLIGNRPRSGSFFAVLYICQNKYAQYMII